MDPKRQPQGVPGVVDANKFDYNLLRPTTIGGVIFHEADAVVATRAAKITNEPAPGDKPKVQMHPAGRTCQDAHYQPRTASQANNAWGRNTKQGELAGNRHNQNERWWPSGGLN